MMNSPLHLAEKTDVDTTTVQGKTTQQKVFYLRFFHPEFSLKDISLELGLTYQATTKAWERLGARHDVARLCPICFTENFDGTVCHSCGFEHREDFGPPAFEDDHHEQVHTILPGRGLGSDINYDELHHDLHLANSPLYLKHYVDNFNNDVRRYEKMKSRLVEELLETSLCLGDTDRFTEFAAKVFDREYYFLSRHYPDLFATRNAYRAIARKVKETIRRSWTG